MPNRRVLSLWFPRLGAERVMRIERLPLEGPLAVVEERGNTQLLSSLNREAEAVGLRRGQPLRDAHAMCAGLLTRTRNAPAEAAFLAALRRWAGRFSPWVADEPPDALMVDLTGCAHLFGGEEPLIAVVEQDCADIGLTVRAGIADTLGAAWALARYAGQEAAPARSGDAIDQEARATRSRAGKRRHRTRGGEAPQTVKTAGGTHRIAAPGQTYGAIGPLPTAALRLDPDTVAQLSRLGLRRISDLLGQPRAGLARRFGLDLVQRLDQAMGSTPEPVSPARPPNHFAVRMTFPDPVGLFDDVMAGVDRMLPRFCALLEAAGHGVRTLRVEAHRTDRQAETREVGLARPGRTPDDMRQLIAMKVEGLDAGFGIDMLRLEAVETEPVHDRRVVGHLQAGRAVSERMKGNTALEDLIGRLGARIGLDAITRRHPGDSHIPEKTAQVLAAAWSAPACDWPSAPTPRPLLMWRPEPVRAPDRPAPPARFRWRGRDWGLAGARGPERIAPEWWLDEPEWRTGPRDYWVVTTDRGDRLWLYYGHGGALSSGWFCQGAFA